MWMEYLEDEIDVPTRGEWYLAQIAAEVASVLSKKRIPTKDRILKWVKGDESQPKMSKEQLEQARAAAKASWLLGLGGKIRRRFVNKAGEEVNEDGSRN